MYTVVASGLIAVGFSFGICISSQLKPEIGALEVVSSLGSILAGVGTVIGVAMAIYVGLQWKVQHRMELFSSYFEGLERFKNAMLLSSDYEREKLLANYPNDIEYTDYDRRRFRELAEDLTKGYDLLSLSFSKIQLQYPEKVSNSFHPKELLLAVESLKQSVGHYKPEHIDYDEYVNNVANDRAKAVIAFELCKKSIKSYVKAT
ncbi:hypothetical protein PD716_13850 [Vibrio gigantis]|uniref:hypothetical protein n=1 Tax=Vibrio gigantis TaxID=296199 RepID=UPI002FC9B92E